MFLVLVAFFRHRKWCVPVFKREARVKFLIKCLFERWCSSDLDE